MVISDERSPSREGSLALQVIKDNSGRPKCGIGRINEFAFFISREWKEFFQI